MKNLPTIVAIIGIAFALEGCTTTPNRETSKAPTKGRIILHKGMSSDEVHDLLGDPLTIKANEDGVETWTYEDSRDYMSQVQAETREVPYIHPISREPATRIEAVTKTKTDRITLTTDLIFYDGKLIRWKESTSESTFYH